MELLVFSHPNLQINNFTSLFVQGLGERVLQSHFLNILKTFDISSWCKGVFLTFLFPYLKTNCKPFRCPSWEGGSYSSRKVGILCAWDESCSGWKLANFLHSEWWGLFYWVFGGGVLCCFGVFVFWFVGFFCFLVFFERKMEVYNETRSCVSIFPFFLLAEYE